MSSNPDPASEPRKLPNADAVHFLSLDDLALLELNEAEKQLAKLPPDPEHVLPIAQLEGHRGP